MNKKNFATLLKKICIFIIPLFLLIGWYLNVDPFKVIHTYKSYENKPVSLNQGYIRWQSYLNFRDSLEYDSFILGNSCAMAYPTTIWKTFIKNGSPILLNANGESLYAINKKIKRLDESGIAIKNVLLLLDHDILSKVKEGNSHASILHPDISHCSETQFQKEFFSAFFNPAFLIPYLDYSFFNTYRDYMKGIIPEKNDYRNQLTNDITNPRELEIKNSHGQYWTNHKKEFPKRKVSAKPYKQEIFDKQRKMLNEISEVFKNQHTNYQIIINPSWSQKKLNMKDSIELENIFEADRIHNFSGKNIYTENEKYFYEKSHYRPLLGKVILRKIYNNKL